MNESIPQDAIHQAAADGNIDLIKMYLTKDPALVSQLHSTQGTIPLIHAIKESRLKAVECLLEAGSPLDFVDKENNRLLMHFTKNHSDTEKKN
jgi:ankyrin repeat protein